MAEQILRILMSELGTVRLLCQAKGCRGVVELPVAKLRKGMSCPLCAGEFDDVEGINQVAPLQDLGTTMRLLSQVKDKVLVEFVVPVKP